MMDELALWQERSATLAAGLPWEETRVGVFEGHVIPEAELDAYIADGRVRKCNTCSSPRQAVFHDRR